MKRAWWDVCVYSKGFQQYCTYREQVVYNVDHAQSFIATTKVVPQVLSFESARPVAQRGSWRNQCGFQPPITTQKYKSDIRI